MRSTWGKRLILLGGLGFAVALAVALARWTNRGKASAWQRLASPGRLSAAHTFLEDSCASCHTPGRGPEAANCVACHASDEALLGRQATAFHAGISSCRECHPEHRGIDRHPTVMDHDALAEIGLRQLRREGERAADSTPHLSSGEFTLDCAACHGTRDRHLGLFGRECAACHTTDRWTIAQFRHPSPRSTDCAQCHQAPPSHYMGHFHMVSAKVARRPHARVNQCHLCHQTTSWNDIKGVGWYKHH
ncbi:MAG: hypothetical protein U0797_07885 [Gemmataceae bacterium]